MFTNDRASYRDPGSLKLAAESQVDLGMTLLAKKICCVVPVQEAASTFPVATSSQCLFPGLFKSRASHPALSIVVFPD